MGTYTVSSDVWSLGLSMIEMALGHYPYPPETYANVFAQLTAIVHGDPPELPDEYSEESKDFVARCLRKVPEMRATYAELMVSVRLVLPVRFLRFCGLAVLRFCGLCQAYVRPVRFPAHPAINAAYLYVCDMRHATCVVPAFIGPRDLAFCVIRPCDLDRLYAACV